MATNRWKEFAYEGVWDISNGQLVTWLTKSSEPSAYPIGRTNRLKIIELNATTLIHIDGLSGLTNTLHRL